MISRLYLVVFLPFLWLSAPLVKAQEDSGIAYVSPKVPDDPNLKKVTMLRLFFIGGPKARSICLVREPKGQKASIIESHISCGTFSPYVAMRPERFTLHTLDGDVTADPVKPLPLEEKKLAEPIKVDLQPGAYFTLLVQEHDGTFTASILTDTHPAESSSSPTMRVLDLSGLKGWSVRLRNRKTNQLIQTLWTSGQANEGISLPASGVYYLEVMRDSKEGPRQAGIFECKLDAGTPFSVILYPGADGGGLAGFAFDASLGQNYDAQLIKSIADGPTAPAP